MHIHVHTHKKEIRSKKSIGCISLLQSQPGLGVPFSSPPDKWKREQKMLCHVMNRNEIKTHRQSSVLSAQRLMVFPSRQTICSRQSLGFPSGGWMSKRNKKNGGPLHSFSPRPTPSLHILRNNNPQKWRTRQSVSLHGK